MSIQSRYKLTYCSENATVVNLCNTYFKSEVANLNPNFLGQIYDDHEMDEIISLIMD